ncbi:hypothetical protein J437_LFUL001317 [Ladona fulva]|uniref:FERM, ARHGEF and pleckstrin domain-containing protein 1 n=1 Tax=Ladona fulva TaxID=123851 RepID=A0A8K0JYT4_LADFU|nr:hypothetical protein J437_LFUL001317 [Ladona fulva]
MTSELVGGGCAGGGVGEGGGGSSSRITPPSPGTPKKGGKMMAVRVQMLDDSVTMFQVQLNLLEADYFGLEYQEPGGTRYWLDLEKPVCRQVGLTLPESLLRFCVKFYTPDPAQLEEEFTRYLFCLQVKRDLAQGLILCNDNTAALMASYIVQAECGDYVVEDYPDHTYLSTYKFVPHQDAELERRIMENHKKHAGQSPAEADLNLLETARRCELYGMKMHPAKDHEGVPLNLAVAHMGIVVFQNFTKINTFSWAKIRKISFKRKRFLVKLHPEGYGYYKDTVEFFFEGRNECKNFWKKCVEHHGFFRCSVVKNTPRQKKRVLSRGSSFRYSGKTQKQIVEYVRENYVKRQTFQRSQSFRHSSSVHSSVANVGTSISAHPLLPLGDNAVVGTPASLSCGSMTLGSLEEALPQSPGAAGGGGSADFDTTMQEGGLEDEEDYEGEEGEECYRVGGVRAGDTPSLATTSRQDTLSPPTSLASSPQHHYPSGIGPLHQGIPGVQQMQRGGGTSTYDDPEECGHRDEEEEEDDDEDEDATVPAGRPIPAHQQRRHQGKETPPSVPPRPSQDVHITERKVNGTHNSPVKLLPSPVSPVNRTLPVVNNHTNQMVQVSLHSPDVAHGGSQTGVTSPNEQKDDGVEQTTSPPLLVNLSKASGQPDSDGDMRRKKFPSDRSYFIAKEMLMTERTYKKDLEVINLWFHDEVTKEEEAMPDEALDSLFKLMDPLHDAHSNYLREIELRLAAWEGRTNPHQKSESQRIGDVILKGMTSLLPLYHDYLGKHLQVLEQLDLAFRKNRKFEQLYRDFEQQKICYLPITSFTLKPLQRLLHYQNLLNRLIKHYGKDHTDYSDCCAAQEKLSEVVGDVPEILRTSENFVQLCELQRDIVGLDAPLVLPGRQFIRQGCLIKLSPKALQQRMFFLFSDMLLYTNRGQHPSMQFKLHGQWPLSGLTVVESGTTEESSPLVAAHSFTIYGANRSLRVAAHGQEEKDKWLEDLYSAIQAARERGASNDGLHYHSLKSCSSSDEVLDKSGVSDGSSPGGTVSAVPQPPPAVASPSTPTTTPTQRSNTTVHVCWHRNTSIGINDQMRAVEDDFPLASLPLLGYYASSPSPSDNIQKDFVFKLQFKNHVYFFRAESEYTFERWMEVISSATQHAGRHRLFSRKDSAQNNGEEPVNG